MNVLTALDWTRTDYFALPLADSKTGGCPNCGGLHYGPAKRTYRDRPSMYRCRGTEEPNYGGAPYKPSCGTIFRGYPGRHFHVDYYAEWVEEPSKTLSFTTELTPEQAITLFNLVATSPSGNGLANVYVDLGEAVRDTAGRTPPCVGYTAPAWSVTT